MTMRRRTLRFEPLEGRLLLAGNVNVTLSGNILTITGDVQSNEIEIAQVGDQTYRVTGIDTRLNGDLNGFVEIPGISNLSANMGNGSNLVSLLGSDTDPFVIAGNVTILSGSGSDTVVVRNVKIGGGLTINTGQVRRGATGNDEILIEQADVTGNLTINAGHDNNRVGVVQTDVGGEVRIITGNGSDEIGLVTVNKNVDTPGNIIVNSGHGALDRIGIAGVHADNLILDGGNWGGRRVPMGNSQIGVTASETTGNLRITTGRGNDQVGVGDGDSVDELIQGFKDHLDLAGLDVPAGEVMVGGNVTILTGDGSDEVLIRELKNASSLTVTTTSGNNQVGVLDSEINGDIRITTGAGSDEIGLVNVNNQEGSTPAGSITVNAGGGTSDLIGIAGVEATSVTLNAGGNAGGRRARGPIGSADIGVTNSAISGPMQITTGRGNDTIAIGVPENGAEEIQSHGLVVPTGAVTVDGAVTIFAGDGNDDVFIRKLENATGLTITAPSGNNRVGVLDSEINGDIRITTGAGSDEIGLVNVNNQEGSTPAGSVTVNAGGGTSDLIGIAGVEATSVTLNAGGNAGGRRARGPIGSVDIGVTKSAISGPMQITTGRGSDTIAIGVPGDGAAAIQFYGLEVLTGAVTVDGAVTISAGDGSDEVLIRELKNASSLTVTAPSGNNRIGVLESEIKGDIRITTGAGSDEVGLMNVNNGPESTPAGSITVNAGGGTSDLIGIAGVQATSITVDDGGNAGGRRARGPVGSSEIGVTGSRIMENLRITTGRGNDTVGLGNHQALQTKIQDLMGSPNLQVPTGPVEVAGTVTISTGDGNDDVWIQNLQGLTETIGAAGLTIDTGNGDDRIGVVDSNVSSGNITINTGNSTGGGGDKGDQVGMIRVTSGNLTVNNSLGNAAFGLAEVTAANVTLNGGNEINSRNTSLYGPSVIGVTNSTMANLTIWQGHPPDGVFIGVHEDFETYFQVVDPGSDDGDTIEYEMGVVNVANGTVSITSNGPGRVSNGDVVRLNHLHAQSLIVNTGLGMDDVTIGENVKVTQELGIHTGSDNDRLTIDVTPAVFWANITAPSRNVDGGAGGGDILRNSDPAALLAVDEVFKGWEVAQTI